jgi:hypothetical protein
MKIFIVINELIHSVNDKFITWIIIPFICVHLQTWVFTIEKLIVSFKKNTKVHFILTSYFFHWVNSFNFTVCNSNKSCNCITFSDSVNLFGNVKIFNCFFYILFTRFIFKFSDFLKYILRRPYIMHYMSLIFCLLLFATIYM